MDQNKSTRIWQWAVLLLVLCNIGLIVTIWLRPLHMGPPRGETPHDYVIRSLKFTEDQVKKYDLLVSDHQKAMRQLREESARYHTLLFANFKTNDTHAADSIAQLIGNNQKQMEMVTYLHFAAVRALCTEPQKAEFDNIINDVMKRMNGPHSGPPPGEGRPPREDGPPPPGDAPPPDRNGPSPNGQ